MPTIGVLVPIDPSKPPVQPEARPVGRAALALLDRGIVAVFGDRIIDRGQGRIEMSGLRAQPGAWMPTTTAISALHDRYPSQRRATRYLQVQQMLGTVPMANPIAVTLLCRDKVECQHFLERQGIYMPPVEDNPRLFGARLAKWGTGFIKPRFGALGTGVRRVSLEDTLPDQIEGVVSGVLDPAILQQSVPAPPGWAGRCVRALVQRLPNGGWHLCEPVVRQSRTDPVVNAARGAQVACATDGLDAQTRSRISRLSQRICEAFSHLDDGQWVVELGLDFMIDPNGHPQLIEVNSRPRGRLEVLADLAPARFLEHHVRACGRPLAYLASIAPVAP